MDREVYLDNAATSFPKPESVYQAVDHFMRRCGGSPGRGLYAKAIAAEEVVFEARRYSRMAKVLAQEARAAGIPTTLVTDSFCDWGRGLVDDVLTPAETVHTVGQLVALFGERWQPLPPAERPNAVIV